MSAARRPLQRAGRGLLLLLPLLCLPAAWPTAAEGAEQRPVRRNEPHVGYVYPAGGRVGTRFKASVGGMFLRQVQAVHVSGEGVHASVSFWAPPPRPLQDRKQARELRRRLAEIRDQRVAVTPGRQRPRPPRRERGEDEERVELPDHPMLKDLESKTVEELQEIARYFFVRRNPLQRKRAIEETVKIEVTIDADAEPGVRDLRLETRGGLTNPIRFHVGLLPEVNEREPIPVVLPDRPPVEPPVVLNGQILPRDTDRFHVRAKQGQQLVFRAEARSLVPYQADSVPGWMQATLTLYDEDEREVAYADEFRYDPDPVLYYEVPEDGTYTLEVQDAISRGRDDFVYRITVGELPFITRIFPLGGKEGTLVNAEVEGYNIGWRRLPLDTRKGRCGIRESTWRQGDGVTNPVAYQVDMLPEVTEAEPNDVVAEAPLLELPHVVNGRIDEPGDVDLFAFKGRGGHEVVAEVCARQLGSPLDSVVRIVDAKGKVVAWNDDHAPEGLGVRGLGLQTHHADAYVRTKLPKSGTYYVRVADVTDHGSVAHAYRLRIGPPRHDVELYVMPATINIPAGRAALITVAAVRKDGFDGDIEITLDDAPEGFMLGGGTIPSGQDRVQMTLSAPPQGLARPVSLRFTGHYQRGREEVTCPALPADDVMQAFLWRHIVPAQELLVAVQGSGGWIPVVALEDEERPVRVPRGGKGRAQLTVSRRMPLKDLRFMAIDAPKGISLGEAKEAGRGFTLEIKASRDAERTGTVDNLIVEAFIERKVRARRGGPEVTRRFSLGYLPAIPYKVVRR